MELNIRKHLATIAIASVAFTAGAVGFGSNPFDHRCKDEGQNNCYWDAQHSGNGKGKSYVVTKQGNVFYFSPSMSEYPTKPFKK